MGKTRKKLRKKFDFLENYATIIEEIYLLKDPAT